MKELDLTRKQVQKDMKELQEMHIIAREGTNRRGRWIIVKENNVKRKSDTDGDIF